MPSNYVTPDEGRNGGISLSTEVICQRCKGSGLDEGGWDCMNCDGMGTVITD